MKAEIKVYADTDIATMVARFTSYWYLLLGLSYDADLCTSIGYLRTPFINAGRVHSGNRNVTVWRPSVRLSRRHTHRDSPGGSMRRG